jgi:hypothetical protein
MFGFSGRFSFFLWLLTRDSYPVNLLVGSCRQRSCRAFGSEHFEKRSHRKGSWVMNHFPFAFIRFGDLGVHPGLYLSGLARGLEVV